MWRHISGSVRGPSHAATGTACQDSRCVTLLGEGLDQTLVACVADGAGSASHSQEGSLLACQTMADRALGHFRSRGNLDELGRGDLLSWCEDARDRIRRMAELQQRDVRQYATTLSLAIVSSRSATFMQIGDSAIVVRRNGALGVVFWPQSGEYANTTNFLTGDRYEEFVEHCSVEGGFTDVALMTDGLHRFALGMDGRIPHAPFFAPLFNTLRNAPFVDGLDQELEKFLDSPTVQQRSEDDKTVVLAIEIPH